MTTPLPRPPITAPLTEHRQWFGTVLDAIRSLDRQFGSAISRSNKQELLAKRHELWDTLTQAFADGIQAEKRTLDFKLNEFNIVDLHNNYYVEIDEYADRSMPDPPRYRVKILHQDGAVVLPLVRLEYLEPSHITIEPKVARNINSEGP